MELNLVVWEFDKNTTKLNINSILVGVVYTLFTLEDGAVIYFAREAKESSSASFLCQRKSLSKLKREALTGE